MKILLVSSGSGSRGGGEIFLLYLGRALAARGHSIMTWIPTHRRMDELASQCAEFSEVIRADYVNTYDHRSRSLATLFNAKQTREIASQWRALAPDVVHVNKQNLEDGLDLLRAARISELPSVCTVHLTQTARYLRARGALLRDIVAGFELRKFKGAFAAVQDVRRKELSSFLGPDARTETIFNGVPLVDLDRQQAMRQAARAELGVTDDQFLIVGLGRLVAQKNPFAFLEVARKLCRKHDHLRFVWVGDGELAGEWKAAVEREGLGEAIRCAGWKSEVRPYLAAADLFLHTAEYEGLPFALIEAMSMGLPSAVSSTVAAELPFLNPGNAIFYDRDDRLEHYIVHPQELGEIGKAGRVMVTQQFSDTAMAAGYERLYAGETARCS
jgi:glycosyltransferase involved in cell wall biosynthesis